MMRTILSQNLSKTEYITMTNENIYFVQTQDKANKITLNNHFQRKEISKEELLSCKTIIIKSSKSHIHVHSLR